MSNLQTKQQLLEERLTQFSLNTIALTKKLSKTTENKILINQLVKSATSIGANYTEANNAASKSDFRAKIFIAKKEAAETRYWLRVIASTNTGVDFSALIDECTQLLFIFQKIISTLKSANGGGK